MTSGPSASRGRVLPAAGETGPLGTLLREHTALRTAADTVAELLRHGPFGETHLVELDERMRDLRFLLPRHLVIEEVALYPELVAADPALAPSIEGIVPLHAAAETAFVRLQADCLAVAVDPASLGRRRRAAKAARAFAGALDTVLGAQEAGPLAAAARVLTPSALARLASALEAAIAHDAFKAAQHR